MKWKFVFNSTVTGKYWGIIDKAYAAARESGYKFFTWNGQVFFITEKGYETTEIEVKDLF